VRQAAEATGRDGPELVPRLPMWLGSGPVGQMTASGRLRTLVAEPAEMVEHLAAYEQAGAAEIVCLFGSSDADVVIDQMERFSAEVMPHFR